MSAAKQPAKKPAKKPAAKPAKKTAAPEQELAEDFDTTKPAYAQLTPAHQFFVDQYILDFNGCRAYLAVPGVDCTEAAARTAASRLLTKANIQAAIQERIVAAGERTNLEISKDRVLKEVARLAFFDIRKLYREDGTMKDPNELDDDTAAALSEVLIFEEFQGRGDDRELIGYLKKAKPYDKAANLKLLMQHMGMLQTNVSLGLNPEDPLVAFLNGLMGTALKPVKAPAAESDD